MFPEKLCPEPRDVEAVALFDSEIPKPLFDEPVAEFVLDVLENPNKLQKDSGISILPVSSAF